MKSAGFINLPDWKNRLQEILTELGREEMLRFPVLGRENAESPWVTLDPEDFFSAVQTGIHFAGTNNIRRLPENLITTDAELAINRLLKGKFRQTFFSAAIGSTFPFQHIICSKYVVSRPEKFIVLNDSVVGFILSKMEKESKNLEQAIHEAQWEKLVGGNPSLNLHGMVTRNRLILQIAHIFGRIIRPESIKAVGINNLAIEDVRIATELGFSIRLLGMAQYRSDALQAIVEPCMIPEKYLLAQARGGSEMIYVKTLDGSSQVYSCPGTSPEIQISGILSDLFDTSRDFSENIQLHEKVESFSDSFYLRFNIVNITDTLARLLELFNRSNIEIEKIYQPVAGVSRETSNSAGQTVVLVTGKTTRDNLEKNLAMVSKHVKLAGLKALFRFIRQA